MRGCGNSQSQVIPFFEDDSPFFKAGTLWCNTSGGGQVEILSVCRVYSIGATFVSYKSTRDGAEFKKELWNFQVRYVPEELYKELKHDY